MLPEHLRDIKNPNLLASWYALDPIASIDRVKTGSLNDSYKIITSGAIYFLRAYRIDITRRTLENEAPLLDLLYKRGVLVPKVFRNIHGDFVSKIGNSHCVLMEYIDGDLSPVEGVELNGIQLANAAKALGRYHLAMQGQDATPFIPAEITDYTVHDFFSKQKTLDKWRHAVSVMTSREQDDIDRTLYAVYLEKRGFLEAVDEEELKRVVCRLPAVLAHGDYRPANLIYKGNDVVAVIDWELARYQPRVWELVRALCAFCKTDATEIFNTPVDFQKAKLFIEAYEAENLLTLEEKAIMFDLAWVASLCPSFLLKTRYVRNSHKADALVPKDSSCWHWWNDNRALMRNAIFGF